MCNYFISFEVNVTLSQSHDLSRMQTQFDVYVDFDWVENTGWLMTLMSSDEVDYFLRDQDTSIEMLNIDIRK